MGPADKDAIFFFTIAFFNRIYMSWVVIYPYLGSYIKHFNPHIRLANFFTANIFFYVGIILGNILLPRAFERVGIRRSFQLGSLLYLASSFLFPYCTNVVFLFANTCASGLLYQLYQLGSLAYFRSRHPEDFIRYMGPFSLGYSVGSIVFVWMLSRYVNPDNRGMEQEINGEKVFELSACARIADVFTYGGVVFCAMILGISFMLKTEIGMRRKKPTNKIEENRQNADKTNNDGKLGEELLKLPPANKINDPFVPKHFLQADNEAAPLKKKDQDDSDDELRDAEAEIMIRSLSKSGLLAAMRRTEVMPEFNWQDEIRSFRFIFLFGMTVARFLSNQYVGDNFHFMGQKILKDDALSASVYAVSTLANVVGRLISGFCWQTFGMKNCYVVVLKAAVTLDLLYIFFGTTNAVVFSLLIFGVRLMSAFNSLFSSMTLFCVYDETGALKMAKFYELNSLVTVALDNVMNTLLVWGDDFRPIFVGFLLLDGTALYLFRKYASKLD